MTRCLKSAQKFAIWVCQVITVVMETMQLVLSQFKNFIPHQLKTEWHLFLPKIISKCCELVKLSYSSIHRSGPVFFLLRHCVYTANTFALQIHSTDYRDPYILQMQNFWQDYPTSLVDSSLRDPAVGPDQFRRDLKTHLFEWHCVSFSALAVFSRNALYKSTFYLLTYFISQAFCVCVPVLSARNSLPVYISSTDQQSTFNGGGTVA